MGNECKAVAGGIATAGCAVGAAATLGQVKEINNAVKDTANFTADNAKETQAYRSADTAACAVKTAGCAVAVAATLGQVDELKDAVEDCANDTAKAGEKWGAEALENSADVPIVGQAVGGIVCAVDEEKGIAMIESANRTTVVTGAGIAAGLCTANPAAGVAAGVAAGAAYDGLESAAKGKACGQIGAWEGLCEGKMENLVEVIATPV